MQNEGVASERVNFGAMSPKIGGDGGAAIRDHGYGSGVTCWRRLRDWQRAGVWEALHQTLLVELNAAGAIDWSRAAVDGSHVRALLGGS